jgi:FAD:protein FMN transferase
MHRFRHAAMATTFEIRCEHADQQHARQAARHAFAAVDRLELQISRFVENSDITRIKHLSPGEETRVSYETMQCLQLALLAYRETGGRFDISIGAGLESLDIVPAEHVVRGRKGGVALDLGGIGKGYAVDRIADILDDWDVPAALIDAGFSSVLALEPPAGEDGWPLTFSTPGDPGGEILLRTAARQRVLGASGKLKGDHIRNPESLVPVRDRSAAWVAAPREVLGEMSVLAGLDPSPAALADALSTAFMIMPLDEIEAYCRAHGGVEAWILEGVLRHYGATAEAGSGNSY